MSFLELELSIDEVELERLELAVSSEWTRATTVVRLRGGGAEGLGEDVTYQPELHERPPVPEVVGRWTLESFSGSLEDVRFFEGALDDQGGLDYRRWAWESAALDLALNQAGTSLADVLDRKPRPVTYVVSTRAVNVLPLLERYPDIRFKLDPDRQWSEDFIDRLAELACVDTADFKGVFRGSFGQPPDARLYRRIAEAFPEAWLEDPGLNEETDEVLRPYRDRITWDAPIHSAADAEALPFPPRCLNVKPSRFGTVRRLFEFYDWCESRGVLMYGGGQFELGVGRAQIQYLASLFQEVTLKQRVNGKQFATLVQLLEDEKGEWLVRFAYSTDGTVRRGPVTLRAADLERLRAALKKTPKLAAVLDLAGV